LCLQATLFRRPVGQSRDLLDERLRPVAVERRGDIRVLVQLGWQGVEQPAPVILAERTGQHGDGGSGSARRPVEVEARPGGDLVDQLAVVQAPGARIGSGVADRRSGNWRGRSRTERVVAFHLLGHAHRGRT
jgi:hypothetical protein